MPRDHELFVGRNHPSRDFALPGGDPRTAMVVGFSIEFHAQPGRGLADSSTNVRRVLTYAGGEYQPVDAAQDRSQGTDLLGRAVYKVIHRQLGFGFASGNEVTHIVANARDA